MRQFLEAEFRPIEHRLHWVLQKADGSILERMVWLLAAAPGMAELRAKEIGKSCERTPNNKWYLRHW